MASERGRLLLLRCAVQRAVGHLPALACTAAPRAPAKSSGSPTTDAGGDARAAGPPATEDGGGGGGRGGGGGGGGGGAAAAGPVGLGPAAAASAATG
jgi:hypothetical protein